MTLDEAIKHARDKANEQKYYASFERGKHIQSCKKCAEEHEQLAEWLEELKEYRDLEEQGKLILFPKYVYFIKDNKVHKGWVQEVVHSLCRKPLYDIRYDDNTIASYRGYLGNKVFLTKEEAEKALDRLECEE